MVVEERTPASSRFSDHFVSKKRKEKGKKKLFLITATI